MGRPAPVNVPSGAPGKQGQRYDLECAEQHTEHGKLSTHREG